MLNKIVKTFLPFFLLGTFLYAQKVTVHGFIEDAETGEKLIGASIYTSDFKFGTATNQYGFFSITLPLDTFKIHCSYTGYQDYFFSIPFLKDTSVVLKLKPGIVLDEVEIAAEKQSIVKDNLNVHHIPIKQVKLLPALLGESDPIKIIQLLPGAHSGHEGSTGIHVRGGSPDQNLILLDGVPVYNVSHLFGFVSVFNPDAIQNVTFYKGGFPARYGGRLSSIIDVQMKEGNNKKIAGQGSIGALSSKLTLEGPIKNEKTSFMIAARRSYADLFVRSIVKMLEGEAIGFHFYDLNAKINHTFSARNRIFFSAYLGKDELNIKTTTESDVDSNKTDTHKSMLGWGNITSMLRWNHIFNKKTFSNVSLSYSKFQFDIENKSSIYSKSKDEKYDYHLFTGVQDVRLSYDIDYLPAPAHYVKLGGSGTYHFYNPGTTFYTIENSDTSYSKTYTDQTVGAKEYDLFIEDEIKICTWLNLNIGLHGSSFEVSNTTYLSLQPRVVSNFSISDKIKLNASYTEMQQYVHLLSNNGLGIPIDLWVPATKNAPPQTATQYALGSTYFYKPDITIGIEGFYKEMNNVIEYKDGASFLTNNINWEKKVESGFGEAYGCEFLIEKSKGKTTGWLAYTLSWANRKFSEINFGKTFPYKYDKRHDISLVINYKLNKKINLSALWVLASGIPVTLPSVVYPLAYGTPVNTGAIKYYNGRNGYRMPYYHRLDVSIKFYKKKKWGERYWSFGLYNAYSRRNPFYVEEGVITGIYADDPPLRRGFVVRSLFPILPEISYNFIF